MSRGKRKKRRLYLIDYYGNNDPKYATEMREVFLFPLYYEPRKYIYLSRYTPYRLILDQDENLKYHETFNNTEIIESDKDTYVTVDQLNENRLDIIARDAYGYPTYWWIIAHANKIIDPFDIPIGTVLRIPPINSLYLSEGVITYDTSLF